METLLPVLAGAPAAALILVTFVGVSLLALNGMPHLIERHLLRPYHLAPRRDWVTLVTSGFFHADMAHLLFNGFSFWAFGFDLERRLGTGQFVALYVIGLLASSLGTWAIHRRNPNYASLGASGAILAVVFAAIVVDPGASLFILPIPYPIPAPLFAVGYLAYSAFASRSRIGRINHDAHIAGAVAGLLFMAVVAPGTVAHALRQWWPF
jgi:membrane associated rhomboid family serine protease